MEENNFMRKYFMICIIIILFTIFSTNFGTAYQNIIENNNSKYLERPLGIIGLSSYIDVTWSANEISKPISRFDMRSINLDIRYGVTQGGLLAQLLFPLHLGRQVNIKIEILEKSEWCTAGLKS